MILFNHYKMSILFLLFFFFLLIISSFVSGVDHGKSYYDRERERKRREGKGERED
jgi:hypothetical protein